MKPIYKSLALANMALAVTLSLQANVTSDGTSTPQAVNAETLEGLKVTLVSPNVSGARDLVASGECVISGNELKISLDGSKLAQGTTHRILVQMEYGTNTVVLYALNITVPRYVTLASGTQEYADNVVVVETFGDGDTSGADASVYAKNGDGNAHITKPLSVGDGIASSDGAAASGYTGGDNSRITANGAGAVASGCTDGEGSYIEASSAGAVASGRTDGGNSYIKVDSAGAVASGYTDGEGSYIIANGDGAVASGRTDGEGSHIEASGAGAVASGYTDSDNSHIEASSNGAVASGYTNGEGSYIIANGDGAVASGRTGGDNSRITANGGGAVASGRTDGGNSYIKADSDGAVASGYTNGEGSYIIANGDGAVASGRTDGEGSHIEASGAGAVASGYTDGEGSYIIANGGGAVASGATTGTSGNVEASGTGSQAFGLGVQATQAAQMVVGQCNVVDEDDTFQFIVGNGADNEHRSNAFGVTKSGSLALFKADGTPIYLDAAKLEALIAMLPSA